MALRTRERCIGIVATSAIAASAWAVTGPSARAGISGAGESALYACNLDPAQPANTVIDFYRAFGPFDRTLTFPPVGPLSVLEVVVAETSLPTGAFAAQIASDHALDAVTAVRWYSSGGYAALRPGLPGTGVWVPGVQRNAHGHSSLVSIKNTDPRGPAQVTVNVVPSAGGSPVLHPTFMIPEGTSITLDMSQDIEFEALGTSFTGSALITSPSPVVVDHYVDVATSEQSVYAAAGVPEPSAVLLAPALFHDAVVAGVKLTSKVTVVNTGPTPVDIQLAMKGVSPACSGAYTATASAVPAGGQGEIDAAGALPDGCAASGVVAAPGPLAAMVSVASSDGTRAAAYTAFAPSEAAVQLVLPRFHKAEDGLVTALLLQNAGLNDGQADVELFDVAGGALACAGCSMSVPAGGAALLDLSAQNDLADGTFGYAAVHSTQPVTAVYVDAPVGPQWDLAADQLCHTRPGQAIPARVDVPLLASGGGDRPPTPTRPSTATPTEGPSPTATATASPTSPPTATATPTPAPLYIPVSETTAR